jgi:hypothetical protein
MDEEPRPPKKIGCLAHALMGLVFPWGMAVVLILYQAECRRPDQKEAEKRAGDAETVRQLYREAEAEAARRAREPKGP